MTKATIYQDQFTGKQYRVMNSNSARVQQYPAGAVIFFDGSSSARSQRTETNMHTRANLNVWLRMMGFNK